MIKNIIENSSKSTNLQIKNNPKTTAELTNFDSNIK